MTVSQTLGEVGTNLIDLEKAKAKVREVEREARFSALRGVIQAVVTAGQSVPGAREEDVRDKAISLAMDIDTSFGLAVSQKLLNAYRNGELDP